MPFQLLNLDYEALLTNFSLFVKESTAQLRRILFNGLFGLEENMRRKKMKRKVYLFECRENKKKEKLSDVQNNIYILNNYKYVFYNIPKNSASDYRC